VYTLNWLSVDAIEASCGISTMHGTRSTSDLLSPTFSLSTTQGRFNKLSENVIDKVGHSSTLSLGGRLLTRFLLSLSQVDDMGKRIDELEQSITKLVDEASSEAATTKT
jgi:hypothetical protein